MHLYSLSAHRSYTQTCLISNLLVSSSSSTITISKVNDEFARLQPLYTENAFAIITHLIPLSADSFCVLSDSGGVSVLRYRNGKLSSTIASVMRSGIRTISPVYAACDPQMRVLVTCGLENERLVFVLGDSNNNIELSGPIDCSQKQHIVYDLCAVDVGYSNPVFCQIERQRAASSSDITSRVVAFYEFDLGLNVLKPNQKVVCNDAHLLIALPQQLHGVLVCCTNRLEYYSNVSTRPVVTIAFPGRALCGTVHQQQQSVFALIQAQDGKIFKLSFQQEESGLRLQYFGAADPATDLHIFKAGFLYVASEISDHKLYQITSLGRDEPVIAYGIAGDEKLLQGDDLARQDSDPVQQSDPPESEPTLELVDSILNFNALTTSRLGSARSKLQHSITVGAGKQIKTLRYQLQIEELVSTPLAQRALQVFVTGTPTASKYIVVCFEASILVLEVGESVSQVSDSGLVDARTLHAQEMEEVLVQVHVRGIRQKGSKLTDWTAPVPIVACAATATQVLVALQDNSVIYFEMKNGTLTKVSTQKLDTSVLSICFAEVPRGLSRSTTVAIGLADSVRVCMIDIDLELTGVQTVPAAVSSVCIDSCSIMHIGLVNGVYMQSKLDKTAGSVLGTKSRLLGSSSVHINLAWTGDSDLSDDKNDPRSCSVVVMCRQEAYATFPGPGFDMVPLGVAFSSVARFSTGDSPQAMAGVVENTLKLFSIEDTKNRYQAETAEKVSGIPRKILTQQNRIHTLLPHSIYSKSSRQSAAATPGHETMLAKDLTALDFACCRFESRKNREMLVVSALRNMRYDGFAQKYDQAVLLVFEERGGTDSESSLALIHTTVLPEAANALSSYNGLLLVGAGSKVMLYDIGLKQLLKKASHTIFAATKITHLAVNRKRVFVGDSRRSVTVLAMGNSKSVTVADDPIARPVASMVVLDYDTVAVGDRLGNFSVLRVPVEASELSSDPAKLPLLEAKPPQLNGAHFKLGLVANYYIGDVITGMHMGIFAPGAIECLLWCGVQGNIGFLCPMSDADAKFFTKLEAQMREVSQSIVGRSHLMYRGYIAPPKNVVDGDLCQQYGHLPADSKHKVALELGTDPETIETRVAESRVRYISMQ